ncbi:MAG: TolC family protein [Edaphobacter sp.]
MPRLLRLVITCTVVAAGSLPAMAQISFTSAVGLSLKNSPKVLMAQADVAKAQAALSESKDVFVPSVAGGVGIGPPSYGFPLGQPTLFSFTAQSLVFSYSQFNYIRASKAAVEAATLTFKDVRDGVIEDTAVTYLALDRDLQRQTALREQQGYASHLISIVQERLDAGQDTSIDLTTAKLSAAQIHLSLLQADDQTIDDQAHLARLIGLPARDLSTSPSSVPTLNTQQSDLAGLAIDTSAAVKSAYANAYAQQQTALGDARYLWRPQISFAAQYNRFATFNNYQAYYLHFQQNNASVGFQITLPIFDKVHSAKARESAAAAAHAEHEADMARDQFLEGRQKALHATTELAARAEVAGLDQQLAQQQLAVMQVQLNAGNGSSSAPQMTPKDEQTSRIAEREKFLTVLDTDFEMRKAEINLLRQNDQLEDWVKSVMPTPPSATLKPE